MSSAYIELYSGWATTERGGFLYGRVHKGDPVPPPVEGDGLADKLHQTFLALDLKALAGARVQLSGFRGAEPSAADGNGFLKVPLPVGMQPGALRVTARLDMQEYSAASVTTGLQVFGASNPPVGIISDIDDTLTDTDVTNKPIALRNTFFHNSYDVKVFPGAPEAVVAVAGRSESLLPTLPLFFLSGSPWALHQRIADAFDLRGLPHGAMILRRYSQEPLDPYEFKHPHLLEIVDANPGYRWILFGDSGEKDPEVYHTLIQQRPNAVQAVFIHNVTGENPEAARFEGFTVFNEWSEVLLVIQQRKLGLRAGC
jgi:phosphatidate phosphatase APP1